MILCADDYGLRDDIDRAILELVGSEKLSAVSCLVVLERCSSKSLAELLAHQSGVDVGLHLCFTNADLPLSVSQSTKSASPSLLSFGALLRKALRGQISPQEITAQVSAQYDLFRAKCGRSPDFIDGHLHVHQLPGVREGLLDFVLSLPTGSRPYIRNTHLPMREIWKRRLPWLKPAFIGGFGARMRERLLAVGIATNDGFAGIYDFRNWPRYSTYLPRFVACLSHPEGILVVHPGGKEEWRRQEFETLRNYAFPPGAPNRFPP